MLFYLNSFFCIRFIKKIKYIEINRVGTVKTCIKNKILNNDFY